MNEKLFDNTLSRTRVTICGSSRFREQIEKAAIDLTKQGCTVFSIICFNRLRTDEMYRTFDKTLKKELVDSHKEKIMVSDAIFVVNVGGYIGAHTKAEIILAKKFNKEIVYLEEKK